MTIAAGSGLLLLVWLTEEAELVDCCDAIT